MPAGQFWQADEELDPAALVVPGAQMPRPLLPPGQYQPTGHRPPTGCAASAARPLGQNHPGDGSAHGEEGVAPPGQYQPWLQALPVTEVPPL